MLWATGSTNREISEQLHFAERTVETQLARLRERLEARNTAQALVICISRGYLYIDQQSRPHVAESIDELLAAA